MNQTDLRRLEHLMAAVALAIAAPTVVLAADLQPSHVGTSCGELEGTWHFVNNQTGGAAAGTLTASFTSVPTQCSVGASAVNQNTQHFFCTGHSGTLLGASTNLPGKLVLSDVTCAKAPPPPPPPPPPCDPKTQVCPPK